MAQLTHNEIVLKLKDELLLNLLKPYLGEIGNWSKYHWVIQKKIKDYTLEEVRSLPIEYKKEIMEGSLSKIKELFTSDWKEMSNNIKNLNTTFQINKTFEYPLIKGEGQYKVTKGFLDLIVHIVPIKIGEFISVKEIEPIEFIIEVKTIKDFDDFGNILRQINEYYNFYQDNFSVKPWTSNLINQEYRKPKRIYCLIAEKIPPEIKEMFEKNFPCSIKCIELENGN